jgi:hypothetical protein
MTAAQHRIFARSNTHVYGSAICVVTGLLWVETIVKLSMLENYCGQSRRERVGDVIA